MAWRTTRTRRKILISTQVDRLFAEHFDIEILKREDRMPLEPSWRERGCDYFFETTYLLTRKEAPVCDGAGRLLSLS